MTDSGYADDLAHLTNTPRRIPAASPEANSKRH